MNGLVGAAAFLTRVPVPGARRDAGSAELAAAVPWFPVIGALVGATTAAVYAIGIELLSPMVAATVAVAAQVLLTGALHEDGLADVADSAGGSSPEARRRILDDPSHGTYGVMALVVSTIVRVAAIASMGGPAALGALVVAGAMGRGASVAMMGAMSPVDGDGLAAGHLRSLTAGGVAAGVVAAGALGALAVGAWALPAAALAALIALTLGRWSGRRLGGVTGDVLGAATVVSEVAVLVLAAGVGPELAWWA